MLGFRSISHRLTFWILSASASLFLAISYSEYNTAQRFLIEQAKSKAHLAEFEMANRLDDLLAGVSESVQTAAGVLSVAKPGEESLQKLLKTLVRNNPNIYGMAIALEPQYSENSESFAIYYHHQGDIVTYVDLDEANSDYRQADWYAPVVAGGEGRWNEPYFDDGVGEVTMVTYSEPIYVEENGQRQLVGVVTADIALSSLEQLVSQLQVGESGFGYLFTYGGSIITHSDSEWVMKTVSDLLANTKGDGEWGMLVDNMMAGGDATELKNCPANPEAECWISYQPVPEVSWSLAIVVPMTELGDSLNHYRRDSFLITAAGLVLLIVVVIFFSRRLTIPLLALAESSRALGRGELDTPIDDFNLTDEVGVLAQQFRLMQGSLKKYIHQLQDETARRERLEGELGVAHDIQMQMLPDRGESHINEAGWQLSACLQPAKSVGGDLYHYQLLPGNRLFFVIGDVSDKGVPAALFMAKAQTLLRQLCHSSEDLSELLSKVNSELCHDNDSCMFVTMFCGILDIKDGALSVASAGHAAPIMIADSPTALDIPIGPALGFYPDAHFEVQRLQLAEDCPLVLTTDGVDEASNGRNEFFGEEGLMSLLSNNSWHCTDDIQRSILLGIEEFRAGAEPSDDLTVMIIRRCADSSRLYRESSFSMANSLQELPRFQSELKRFCQQGNLSDTLAGELMLVCEELLVNTISYGYQGEQPHQIDVGFKLQSLAVACSGEAGANAELVISLSDDGKAFNPLEAVEVELGLPADEAPIGGLGIPLVLALSDSQHYQRIDGRNVLKISKMVVAGS